MNAGKKRGAYHRNFCDCDVMVTWLPWRRETNINIYVHVGGNIRVHRI
jgi:hypothetical protein